MLGRDISVENEFCQVEMWHDAAAISRSGSPRSSSVWYWLGIMAGMAPGDQAFLEKLFRMESGYVLSFANSSFRNFVAGSTGEDIYSGNYAGYGESKANRLRAYLALAAPSKVKQLLDDLRKFMIQSNELEAGSPEAERLAEIARRAVFSDSIVETNASGDATDLAGLAYQLEDVIGRGGYGEVRRATRETAAAKFTYAIKLLAPSSFAGDPETALSRFQREIRALQGIQHRAIVPCFDAGITAQGVPFLVMPLVEGKNLQDATEGMSLDGLLPIFLEIVGGIAHAHSRGVLHRDLKPSNVLVRDSDGQPVVLDFGCSYLLDDMDEASLTITLIGSIGYIPSEVIANPKLRTPQHDVFSCGVMLYQSIERRKPDPQAYQPLTIDDERAARIDQIVRRSIAPASERFDSAEALRLALEELLRK